MSTCEGVALIGWYVGIGTGLLADIAIVILVMMSPPLGAKRAHRVDRRRRLRRILIWSVGVLPLIWAIGGYAGRGFLACYSLELAIAAAAVTSVVLLLGLFTAGNQIGRRSVQ